MAAVRDPGVPVAALLSAGFTDCHFFREKGIPCYGFMPFRLNFAELATFHGNNERLSTTNVGYRRQFMLELVRNLVCAAVLARRFGGGAIEGKIQAKVVRAVR